MAKYIWTLSKMMCLQMFNFPCPLYSLPKLAHFHWYTVCITIVYFQFCPISSNLNIFIIWHFFYKRVVCNSSHIMYEFTETKYFMTKISLNNIKLFSASKFTIICCYSYINSITITCYLLLVIVIIIDGNIIIIIII